MRRLNTTIFLFCDRTESTVTGSTCRANDGVTVCSDRLLVTPPTSQCKLAERVARDKPTEAKGAKGGKGQPAVTLTAAETTALAVRAAHTLSSQDIVKRQKRTGKELRQMLAPVPDGDKERQPGATALVKILTLSERAALRDDGTLGSSAPLII